MKRLPYPIALVLLTVPALAQEKAVAESSGNYLMNIMIVVFIVAVLLLLAVAVTLLRTFKALSSELLNPTALPATKPEPMLEWDEWYALEKTKPGLWSKFLSLKPISEEKDIMLDHEFDGISELDNPTPPWFMWLFYATIAFAVVYLLNFHVLGYGKMQEEEYAIEMAQAKAEKDAYLAKSANKIDENSVKENQDASVLAAGKAIYAANCVACHGDKGQGSVGPNLTDPYWIHGGKVNNIFKTIKYGVPEKGMISWEKTLSPKQISEVANYILSLKGSNPANPKAPQGQKEG